MVTRGEGGADWSGWAAARRLGVDDQARRFAGVSWRERKAGLHREIQRRRDAGRRADARAGRRARVVATWWSQMRSGGRSTGGLTTGRFACVPWRERKSGRRAVRQLGCIGRFSGGGALADGRTRAVAGGKGWWRVRRPDSQMFSQVRSGGSSSGGRTASQSDRHST